MNRILVIRFSAMGDVAMTVPVVRALAEQYPAAEITMLSHRRMSDLFADMPANVRFVGINTKQQSLRELVAGLGQYDYVADLHGVWRSRYIRLAMCLRGARVRTIQKGRFSRFLLTHRMVHQPLKTIVTRYCETLQGLGFPIRMPKAIITETGEGIGIAPFAAHPGKAYPIDKTEEVVRLLSEHGEQIVLFGSKEEANVLESWAKKYRNVKSVAGLHTLGEELEVMRGVRVMLTMDSANMHLASLVGTRVVSIWGATHPNAGFLGFGQRTEDCIQRDLACRPCSIYGNKKCRYGDYRCLAIAPEEIVERLLAKE